MLFEYSLSQFRFRLSARSLIGRSQRLSTETKKMKRTCGDWNSNEALSVFMNLICIAFNEQITVAPS